MQPPPNVQPPRVKGANKDYMELKKAEKGSKFGGIHLGW